MKTITWKQLPIRIRDRLIMQPAVQAVLAPFGKVIKPAKWVFIVGCYNSGTTLLANLLQSHAQMNGLPNEGAFLSDVLPIPERYGWPRMWSECEEEIARDQVLGLAQANRIKKQWSIWADENSPVLVEKSISNILRLDFLQQYFDPAYFIYIVRDPAPVAAGIRKKANIKRWGNTKFEAEYPIELCAKQWLRSEEVIRACESSLNRHLRIRYEDLTEQTDATMKSIADFLGVEGFESGIGDSRWSIHEKSTSVKNMNGSSMKHLSQDEVDVIYRIAEPQMAANGYSRK